MKKTITTAVLAVSTTLANAAVITWSAAIDSTTILPVAPGAGETLVEAMNVGGDAITVNGIDFEAGNTAGAANYSNSDVITSLAAGDSVDAASGVSIDADFDTMLDSHRWATAGADATATVTLNNLVNGQAYRIQLGMTDFRTCCAGRDYTFGDGEATENLTSLWTRGTNVHFTGTFTASGTTQAITINTGTASSDPGISFYTITAVVPEPSSTALLGLGGLALILRRRK